MPAREAKSSRIRRDAATSKVADWPSLLVIRLTGCDVHRTIDFAKQHEFQVDVFDHEHVKLGSGVLTFGSERWIQVSFGFLEFSGIPEGAEFSKLTAVLQRGTSFTLFKCKKIGFGITANYIVAGDVGENFKSIEIRYSDVSEWYLGRQWIEGDIADSLRLGDPVKHFTATIKTEQETFTLASRSERSVSRTGENHIFHEHVLFCFDSHDTNFSIVNIQTKAMDLLRLLSILIAHPVSIISIEAVCDKGNSCMVFFPTYSPVERKPSRNSHFLYECFIRQQDIHDRWESIVNGYFNSDYREVSWARLAGMQRYEGFWEYRALGYVSLLDKYVSQRHEEKKSQSVTLRNDVKEKLKEAISLHSAQLEKSIVDELLSELVKAFEIKSFAKKYQHAIAESSQDMVKIINISEEDFRQIKKVRDKIAHGDAIDLSEFVFERTQIIVNKIILLMTYWAFMDFGLENEDFLRCLVTTHHDLLHRAKPDTVHIARMLRPEDFFTLSNTDFEKLSSKKRLRIHACFVQHNSGVVEYSEQYSAIYQAWWSAPDRISGLTNHSDIFGVAKERIKYLNSMYVLFGENFLELSAAFIIQVS